MISYLEGEIKAKRDDSVVLLIGGVGYQVRLHPDHALQCGVVGNSCSLYIHTHVREDELTLYGFLRHSQLVFFETLLTVSGVGPKVALNICGTLSIGGVQQAILREDLSVLRQVPGVGKKMSERLFLELRDRVSLLPVEENAVLPLEAELVDALLAMGYSREIAIEVIPHVQGKTLSECLQGALQYLGKKE